MDLFDPASKQPAKTASDQPTQNNFGRNLDISESSQSDSVDSLMWTAVAAQQIWSPAGEVFDATPPQAVAQDGPQPAVNAADNPSPKQGDAPHAQQENAPGRDLQKSIQWLERAVELSDRTDVKQAQQRIVEGQANSINLVETMTQPGLSAERRRVLGDMNQRIHSEKWQEYERYLDPALARAELALAKIVSGDDKQIAEGEKGLIAAVAMRPELQFNEGFQRKVLTTYLQMETTRKNKGLPAWNGQLRPEGKDATTGGAGSDPNESMAKANEAFQNKGIKDAVPLFEEAIRAADNMPQERLARELSELFCRRLTIERTIAGKEVRNQNVDALQEQRTKARDAEWEKYSEYLSPGSTRVNTALAMISSGDPDLLRRGKSLLGEAITKRPELEFDSDFQVHLHKAFETHHKNKPVVQAPGQERPSAAPAEKTEPFKIGYKQFESKDLGSGQSDLENDKEVSSYLSDTLTGPVLTAAVLYLGYRVAKGRIERVRARRAAAAEAKESGETDAARAENKPRDGESKPGETKQGENKPGETAGAAKPRGPNEVKPAEPKPEGGSTPRPTEARPSQGQPPEPRTESPRLERPATPGTAGGTTESNELRIETSPFESGNQGTPRLDRPAAAMEAGKMVEIQLPGGIVARMAKADAPKFLDKVEREFKTEEFGKVLDEMINDKGRSEEERRELREMKERYDKLPPEVKEECKMEFFRTARAQLGLETETTETERARSGRVGRALAVGGTALGIGILSVAVLRYCMNKEKANNYNRVDVQFIKKP